VERLEKRKNYYQNKYGLQPYFKAGGHVGRVTVAEVGLLKREIAFHGDTVNTASRIHDFCNKYNQQLLLSKNLYDMIQHDGLQTFYIGDHVLKGKYHSMELFGIKKSGPKTKEDGVKIKDGVLIQPPKEMPKVNPSLSAISETL
jgi:adenylate cyclase